MLAIGLVFVGANRHPLSAIKLIASLGEIDSNAERLRMYPISSHSNAHSFTSCFYCTISEC